MALADDLIRQRRDVAKRLTMHLGEDILGEAQRLAPLEEGTLGASGDVEFVVDGDTFEVRISFSTVYATRQHEEEDWHHIAGRQAHYLSAPFNRRVNDYPAMLARAIRTVTR